MSGLEAMPRYVGRSVKRVNDPKLLLGAGRFIDDFALPGMLHATIVRSTFAHATVTSFDASATDAALVLGPDDIEAATHPIPCVWLAPGQRVTEYPVASRRLLYVGQPYGIVVSGSRAEAEDAAELLQVDVDEGQAVVTATDALHPDAPLLRPELSDNLIADFTAGDPPEVIEAQFAAAAHVVERTLQIQRVAPNPMEPRGVVARWDTGAEELTVWMSTQTPHHVRDHLAISLKLRAEQVRVVAWDVGGGFGSKEHLYTDEAIVCLAAMRLNRPVKWIEDRVEHQTATGHGRDALHRARLALDADGRFLAISTDILGNLGAHPSNVGLGPFRVSASMLPGPYRFAAAGARIRAACTTTTPTGAYRGFGMQEAAWVRERLVEEAARELGIDPVELRLRNMYQPEDLPTTTPTFQRYDSGDYPGSLRLVAEQVAASRDPEPDDPRTRRGVGFSSYVEFTGLGPSDEQQLVGFALGGYETALVRVEPDGSVVVSSGVMGMGQGIETTLAQLTADNLAVPLEKVTVRLGDTSFAPYSSTGSIASRSITVGGGSVVVAATRLRERLIALAAHRLEASPRDITVVVDDGETRYQVAGDPEASVALPQIAETAWLNWELPEGAEVGLEERYTYNPPSISFSYASHAAQVAVDLDTGICRVEKYWVAHDSGVLVNPMIVDGQIVGGIAQGLGMALHEQVTWSENGQPLTTTFLDYVLPQSSDVPDVWLAHMETPSPFTPGGMKGLGEGGVIPTPATIANAVANAVPEIAAEITETPLSPARVWSMLAAKGLTDG